MAFGDCQMAVEFWNGLSNSEAESVVAVGCMLMASGLAGAVGRGRADDGTFFVEILAPENGAPMFLIGKEHGRYFVRSLDGQYYADGGKLARLVRQSAGERRAWIGGRRPH